jgi:hypothetical protein
MTSIKKQHRSTRGTLAKLPVQSPSLADPTSWLLSALQTCFEQGYHAVAHTRLTRAYNLQAPRFSQHPFKPDDSNVTDTF